MGPHIRGNNVVERIIIDSKLSKAHLPWRVKLLQLQFVSAISSQGGGRARRILTFHPHAGRPGDRYAGRAIGEVAAGTIEMESQDVLPWRIGKAIVRSAIVGAKNVVGISLARPPIDHV